VAGLFHRQVGGRHADRHHHPPEAGLHAPERARAQREGDRDRTLHPQWRLPDVDHDRRRSAVSHRAVHQEPQLCLRAGVSVRSVSVFSGSGDTW
jgi:hypothetical protein